MHFLNISSVFWLLVFMSKYLHVDPGKETKFLSSDFIQYVSLHYHIMRFHTTDGSIFHKEYTVSTKLLGVTSKIILTSLIKLIY